MSEALPKIRAEVDAQEVAMQVATFLDSKRAEEIAVLFVRDLIQVSSYFVIATGTSKRVLQTLADGCQQILKHAGLPRLGMDGGQEGHWICIDYGEVVVHLFDAKTRNFYALEELWGDAPRVEFERASDPGAPADS
ncbi:MAG: ribosome silencing factor [Planctomycetota bacterium]